MKNRRILLITSHFTAAFVTAVASLHAASGTWTGATSATWQVNNNWNPSTEYPQFGGNVATFNGAGNGNTNISLGGGQVTLGGFNVNGALVFDTANAAAYTIGDGTILFSGNTGAGPNFGGNNIFVKSGVVTNQAVNANLTIGVAGLVDAAAFRNDSAASTITFGGTISVSDQATPPVRANNLWLEGNGAIVISGNITDGINNKIALNINRTGTTTLSGANTFTGGIVDNSAYNVQVGRGTLILDYGTNANVLPAGTKISIGSDSGGGKGGNGSLYFKGNSSGTTSQTLGDMQMGNFDGGFSTITVDRNGGSATTVTFGSTWSLIGNSGEFNVVNFDLSSGGVATIAGGAFSGGQYSVANGIIIGQANNAGYAAVTVKGTDNKTHFANLDGSGNIVAQTTLTALPDTGASSTVNYSLSGSQTFGASNQTAGTLRIDGSGTLDLNTRQFSLGSRMILMDGASDYTISNGTLTGNLGFDVVGTGKLTVSANKGSGGTNRLEKFGSGLLELTGTNSGSNSNMMLNAGVTRADTSNALTSGNLYLQGGVLELGYDFTRALGQGGGAVRFTNGAPGGFSAYGADRFVNIGGAGATLTFGTSNFVDSHDSKLMLSSASSDATIDFQNPLNFNGTSQTIEVANGSAIVDATLSGTLSSTNGGLTKTGAGTLNLTGTNTYTGATVVGAGTLLVNAGNSGTGLVSVNPGATLGGAGSLAGDVIALGTIAPGNSAGTLTTGAATLKGTLAVEIDGTTGDKLVSTGAIDITGSTLTVSLLGGGFTQPSYVIAEGTSLTGTFASVPSGYSVTYNATQAILAQSGGVTYASWLAANPPATGFDTDSDTDGVSNGVENILGTNPNAYSAGLTQVSATASTSTFKHKLSASVATDVTRSYQWSTDLVEWKSSGQTNTGGTTATITPSAPVSGEVTVVTAITGGAAGKIFTRLVATKAP